MCHFVLAGAAMAIPFHMDVPTRVWTSKDTFALQSLPYTILALILLKPVFPHNNG
jgi:hypothetical protein